jgi:hypothetical protein
MTVWVLGGIAENCDTVFVGTVISNSYSLVNIIKTMLKEAVLFLQMNGRVIIA